MPIDNRVNTDPVLSIGQPPDKKVVALGTFLVIAMLDEEVPCHFIIAEAIECQDLRADVFDVIVSCFDEEDRVSSACKIDSNCTCVALASNVNNAISLLVPPPGPEPDTI